MEFSESDEFKKELKKLKKKYSTLVDDIEVLKKIIAVAPKGKGKHDNILKSDEEAGVYIIKTRMMCRAVRGSQFRVIYAYDGQNIEVLFIEVYYKGNKENEDRERVQEYFESLKNKSDT